MIASQARQENFSRTCWITFHWRGTSSSVSVTSSPSLRKAAAAARAGRRRRIDDALARQMLGQRPARRLAPLEALHRDLRAAAAAICAAASACAASSSRSASCSSSCSSSAPRSEDCPNCSCRSLAIVNFSFSISSARCSPRSPPRCARFRRQQRRALGDASSPSASARSSGSESSARHRATTNHNTTSLS